MTRVLAAASVIATLACPTSVYAQGKSNDHKGQPPSKTRLPSSTAIAPAVAGAVPFAWIDDATVLPAGTAALSFSVMRWDGADLSEVDVPVIGVSAGLTRRVQIGASVPHVVGSDEGAVESGVGTSYIGVKIGLSTTPKSIVKIAIAPTVEILGAGAVQALVPGESRTHVGVPVSVEVDRGGAHLFGSAGFFSQGVWFAGGGVSRHLNSRVSVSAALSRAWSTDTIGGVAGDRRELSGSVAVSPRPRVSIFGSLGRTIATADEDGAGTTISGGVMLLFTTSTVK